MAEINIIQLDAEELRNIVSKAIRSELSNGTFGQIIDHPKYLTREETSKVLQISLPTLHTYTKLGLIPAKRIGTRILYSENDLHNALQDIPTKLSRR